MKKRQHPGGKRAGFTMLEIMLALGILVVALVMVAQVATYGLTERARSADRQEALEHAANILEKARALPWEALTPQWAATQTLSEPLAQHLFQGRQTVRVEPEKSRPRTKRVTVEIRWKQGEAIVEAPVQLVGLFSARSTEPPGGKP